MTFLLMKNSPDYTEVKWMYLLSYSKTKSTHRNRPYQHLHMLTLLSSCHQMCVRERRKDWHSRNAQTCDFKGFNPFILTSLLFFMYLHNLCLIPRMTWIHCNVRCVVWGTMKRFVLLKLKDWVMLKYSVSYLKKGIYIIVTVYCLVPWNWPCQLYMYRYSF